MTITHGYGIVCHVAIEGTEVPKNLCLGIWCLLGAPFSASLGNSPQPSEFSSPSPMTIASYQTGVMTGRISVEESPNGWQVRGVKRDPATFKQQQGATEAVGGRFRVS